MKKLLFVLVCAASLGFWMSCSNETQELDVTLHSGVDTKEYSNAGTVAAKKMTMVTHKGAKVEYKDGKVANKPTDRDDYYISVVEELSADKKSVKHNEYWFYNDWDSGTDIAADKAFVSWSSNVWYESDGASSGKENVSNTKEYKFSFGTHNDDVDFWIELPIQKKWQCLSIILVLIKVGSRTSMEIITNTNFGMIMSMARLRLKCQEIWKATSQLERL